MAISSKKDKLVENAQKFVIRGQFDKAVIIYEQIIALEPAAINHRQKLAELLIKCGRNDDARKELETIGNYFSKNGFYLKAIAVYKQLQKFFPADISLTLKLAELYEKHGLVANALSEYKLVFEFYEKTDNITEALSILDRMQNVDPQNIPIKIKLAEAYVQHGKRNESYDLFLKTASLLLERSDNAVFSKVCTRISGLFPDKPDFLLEILTEQISRGKAATAIVSIQSLLRSNPNNKRAWDLVVQAYQQLEQPQRVKIAYQHYLRFFPSEPAAIFGLINSVTAEQNLAGALELLDQYEAALISGGLLQQLAQIYHSLDKIDPINIRVLEGLIRVATAAGNESELHSLISKLQSLRAVSDHVRPLNTTIDSVQFPEEDVEIEIDIDIDIDSPFGSPAQETDAALSQEDWLDSIDNLFGSIDTAPRRVKFGNEMERADAQSHYDLGQAFKEMGLYDEAINEFRQAAQEPSRRVECLIMQCACLKERGEVDKAVTILLALLQPGLSEEESCTVKYELASAYEAAGNNEEANLLLNEINATNSGFRDISSRLNAAHLSESLDFSDEDLKDF
jgi:tetratricopeptide (TPR) repeat protein